MRSGNRYRRLYNGATYDTAAVALFARMTGQPSQARKSLIDRTIRSLKAGGVWPLLDCLYVMAAHDAQAARLNWKTDANNLTAVSSPTFAADRGYTGDGASSYLNTNFVASTSGVAFTQNNAHLAVWSRTSAQNITTAVGARNGVSAGQSLLILRNTSDQCTHRINQDSAGTSIANVDGSGFFIACRSGASASEVFRNGVSLGTGAVASTAVPTFAFFVGALNTAGSATSFSTYQLSCMSAGGNLTSDQASAYTQAMQTYMTAVGA